MSCFDNIISVEDCSTSTALYDLKEVGIDREFLNQITDKSFGDGVTLGASKIAMARKIILNALNTHFSKAFNAKALIENRKIGYSEDDLRAKTGANYRGIEIMVNGYNDFIDLYIHKIALHLDTSGATEIKVFDLIQGKEIDSISVTAVAEEITELQVDKTYTADRNIMRLAFVYDATGISSYKTNIKAGGCGTCTDYTGLNGFMSVRGVEAPIQAQITKSDLSSIGHTSGMLIDYSLQCNKEEWMCRFRNLLGLPMLYKSASEIYSFAMLQNERINNSLAYDRETLAQIRDEFEMKYRESLDNVIGNMNLPNDSKCVNCRKTLKTRISLP